MTAHQMAVDTQAY